MDSNEWKKGTFNVSTIQHSFFEGKKKKIQSKSILLICLSRNFDMNSDGMFEISDVK